MFTQKSNAIACEWTAPPYPPGKDSPFLPVAKARGLLARIVELPVTRSRQERSGSSSRCHVPLHFLNYK